MIKTKTEFFQNVAEAMIKNIDEFISKECDIVYRGDRYRRQWAFIEIKKRVIELMIKEKLDLQFLESELMKREDNMWSYLQAERCPACKKTECKIHCNFTGCGEPIDWIHNGYQYVSRKSKKTYPINPDGSIHLLCHVSRTRERGYYLEQIRDLMKLEQIEWVKKMRD